MSVDNGASVVKNGTGQARAGQREKQKRATCCVYEINSPGNGGNNVNSITIIGIT